jgi:response regulator RpfG family c-di-GMP phosphodiesterase
MRINKKRDYCNILTLDDPHNNLFEIFKCLIDRGYLNISCAKSNTLKIKITQKEFHGLILSDPDLQILNGLEILKRIQEKPDKKLLPVIINTEINPNSDNYKKLPAFGIIDSIQTLFDTNEIKKLIDENKNLKNQLQFKTLQSARCNDLIIQLSNTISKLVRIVPDYEVNCKQELLNCLNQMKQYHKNGIWNEFKLRFAEVHTGFYDALLNRYPSLTESDLRLCALIKLKLSTKEIAAVINLSVNSVKVSRSRLRSKLQLKDTSEPLLNFLALF